MGPRGWRRSSSERLILWLWKIFSRRFPDWCAFRPTEQFRDAGQIAMATYLRFLADITKFSDFSDLFMLRFESLWQEMIKCFKYESSRHTCTPPPPVMVYFYGTPSSEQVVLGDHRELRTQTSSFIFLCPSSA